MKRPTKRTRALLKTIARHIHPPKRYKHQKKSKRKIVS